MSIEVEHVNHADVLRKRVKASAVRLLKFSELESWRQDNEWIWTGYRESHGTYSACIHSLTYLHNETGNVYSHLIGSLFFVGLSFYVYTDLLADALVWDKVIFGFFLLSAISCMGISALFHLFSSHSEQTCASWNRGDYLGITLLIVGSASPALYYALHCEPYLQAAYMTVMVLLGLTTVPFIFLPRFNKPTYRSTRTWIYVLLGCSGVGPMLHAVYSFGLAEATRAGALEYMAAMGAFYLIGALLYAARLPERHFPGRFDYWLHSHQIFHLCVFAAALIHFGGLVAAFSWHKENACSVRSEITSQMIRMAGDAAHQAHNLFEKH